MTSAPENKIKVGFVGLSATTGWAATTLAPALIQPNLRENYDLVAVSTTSEASAKASADKYSQDIGHPIAAYFGDASNIVSDPDVDLVAVSVKAPHHKEIVLKVIEAKKDFFVEWPAGTSTKETEEIAAAAHKQGVRSFVGLQGRHAVVIQKVKELLASGVIGTIRSTNVVSSSLVERLLTPQSMIHNFVLVQIAHLPKEAHFYSPFNKENNAYLLEKKNGLRPLSMTIGIRVTMLTIVVGHQLDTLTHVLGDFSSVTATNAQLYPTVIIVDDTGKPTGKTFKSQSPDHFAITGVLKTGILANIFWRAGYSSNEGRRQYVWEIEGEEGSIRLQSDHLLGALPSMFESELYLNGKKVEFETPGNGIVTVSGAWKEFASRTPGTYATIEDAVKHHRLLDAIEASAKEGKRIIL
ncbi:hypothetical protein CVT25_002801 [Psilocybe cyanescens]|uniref:Gfo/Idh/MocA-like oxidoreductase N-terminal domain-containing protein n=1 Tax=Psilocybe cyanescens TaxID=93625 RepID=A0A409WL21_PSICY|nr:hypothetical protein CVT25_002801 [Psilocybe cyanescens]